LNQGIRVGGLMGWCGRRVDGVVPVAVEVVPVEALFLESFHVAVGDADTSGVAAGVQLCSDGQPGLRYGRAYRVDDDFVAGQWPPARQPSPAMFRI
jgi:hypothetical protein